jgi:hypothetical protein
MLESKIQEWERVGLVRPLGQIKYERWCDRAHSVSDRFSVNCDRYRLMAWWNPIKWLSLAEMQRLRAVARRMVDEHSQLMAEQKHGNAD